jgi:hypothetical protein
MKIYNKNQLVFLSILLVIGIALLSSCGVVDSDPNVGNNNYSATETFSLTFETANKSELKISSINGPIEVFGVDGTTQVKVEGEKKVDSDSEADANAHLQDLEVQISESGGAVDVETKQPKETFGRNYSVYYKIYIPKNFKIEVDLTNGEVYIDSLSSDVDIDLTNGNIMLNEIFGNVNVDVTNGQIDGKIILPHQGSVDMGTTNGGINVSIPQATSANLSAQVTNGIVRVTNLTMTNMTNSSKKITGKMGTGDGSIQLKTTNGNIQLSGF